MIPRSGSEMLDEHGIWLPASWLSAWTSNFGSDPGIQSFILLSFTCAAFTGLVRSRNARKLLRYIISQFGLSLVNAFSLNDCNGRVGTRWIHSPKKGQHMERGNTQTLLTCTFFPPVAGSWLQLRKMNVSSVFLLASLCMAGPHCC